MNLITAIFKGFVYTIVLVIILTISIVGLIPILVAEMVIKAMLEMVLPIFGAVIPANVEQVAAMVLFICTWIGFTITIAQGNEHLLIGAVSASTRRAATTSDDDDENEDEDDGE